VEIISHRGFWLSNDEKNSKLAFERSFQQHFGTETDIRDFNGELVISHDIPVFKETSIDDFFSLYLEQNRTPTLALNIKSDGLTKALKSKIEAFGIQNYFCFDMSIPDTIQYLHEGLNFYIRQSEYELDLPFYEEASGVWLDSFQTNWFSNELIENHLHGNNKRVCIVSSELHGRDHLPLWNQLLEFSELSSDRLILCTDKPEEALIYFENEN
jgi:glycerophosphoryl diester phosphodiesterase